MWRRWRGDWSLEMSFLSLSTSCLTHGGSPVGVNTPSPLFSNFLHLLLLERELLSSPPPLSWRSALQIQSRFLLHFEPCLLFTNFTWLKIVVCLIPWFKCSAQGGGLYPDFLQPSFSMLDNPICLSVGVQNLSSSHPRGLGFSWV